MRFNASIFRAMGLVALVFSGSALTAGAGRADAADVELWRLDCGSIVVKDLSLFSDTYDYAGQKKILSDSCYLIRHDRSYMLWDTGLPEAFLDAPVGDGPMAPTLRRTLLDQLKEIEVEPGRIEKIGISHYHFDHVGQAADFPAATLLIGKADLDALKSTPPPFGAEPGLLEPWLKGGAPAEPVSGDKDIFGDGSVVMLATPGHTPGSHSLLVRLPQKGPVILAADVVHFEEQFAHHGVPPFNTDRADTLASMDRVEHMAKTLHATVIICHEVGDIKKLPAFPKSAK